MFLALYPVNFELAAEGSLQPELRRHVFAEADGVVDQLSVGHGDPVSQGKVLVTLRSSDMDLRMAEIRGELETTTKKLAATKAARVSSSSATDKDRLLVNQMAAEEEELREWLINLRQQQQLLSERKENLLARSPIDGEVITWDLENLLTARPVAKGDILMTVADTEGPWVLELLLVDRRVGHLRDALRDLGDELDVSFMLATNPGVTVGGKIKKVAKSTIIDETYGLCLPVTADITESDIDQLRPGAKVRAKIHCGRRCIGYVWLHEVFEFIQSRVLFRL
jgi:multidrug efflux pump subunit AcrA (membrane-fusion protein)